MSGISQTHSNSFLFFLSLSVVPSRQQPALALEKEKDNAAKRHTMSHPPEHIPDLDSPRQSRSPLKKDKKEQVSTIYISIQN